MTASLPLREPFFLRGRKSVLQRAVIMSCALTGLTSAAGWIAAVGAVAWKPYAVYFIEPLVVEQVAMAVAITLFVHVPLHYWNRRIRLWSLAAFPVVFFLLELNHAWLQWVLDHLQAQLRFPAVLVGAVGLVIGNGLLQVRWTRVHLLAYLVSVAGVGLLLVATFAVLSGSTSFSIPGLAPAMAEGVMFAIGFGMGFAALAIPWGLPFWWPPADDNSPAPPVLFPADLLD